MKAYLKSKSKIILLFNLNLLAAGQKIIGITEAQSKQITGGR